jgi:hypothetical protein
MGFGMPWPVNASISPEIDAVPVYKLGTKISQRVGTKEELLDKISPYERG